MTHYPYYPPQRPMYPPPRRRSSKRAWITVAILAVVGVIGLVIFGAVLIQPSTSSSVHSTTTTAISYTPAEQKYLDGQHRWGVPGSDDKLLITGYMVCSDVLDHGMRLDSEVLSLMAQGWSNVSAQSVVGGALLDLCPTSAGR
jgi:Protein of unknown function (DUF732)